MELDEVGGRRPIFRNVEGSIDPPDKPVRWPATPGRTPGASSQRPAVSPPAKVLRLDKLVIREPQVCKPGRIAQVDAARRP